MAISLSPGESVVAASFAVASVLAIFADMTPDLGGLRETTPHHDGAQASIFTAALTSAAVISGMSLLAKSPEIFVTGGVVIVIEGLVYWHANHTNPRTGKNEYLKQ
jgi:hypothetical protein